MGYNYTDVADVALNEDILAWDLSQVEIRTILEAKWIIDNNVTVRSTAPEFGVSKSTVHYDMVNRLKHLSTELYDQVNHLFYKHRNKRS